MESKIGKKGKVIQGQTREFISHVIDFMRNEADIVKKGGAPLIPLANYKQRAIAATGISHSTYEAIVKEAKQIAIGEATSFKSPRVKVKNLKQTKKYKEDMSLIKMDEEVKCLVKKEKGDVRDSEVQQHEFLQVYVKQQTHS